MQAALEILGCKPSYHMYTPVYQNIYDCDKWIRAFEAHYHGRGPLFTRDDWDDLLGHHRGVTDAPCACFALELLEAYPEAKVVLVERDVDKWYESFEILVTEMYNPTLQFLRIIDPPFFGRSTTMLNYIFRDRQGFFQADDKAELLRNAKTLYREHYDRIRRVCPPDRLLNFRLEDGWGPLCEFLGKKNPGVPFPRVNERAAMVGKVREFQRRRMLVVLRKWAFVAASVWAGWLAVGWVRR